MVALDIRSRNVVTELLGAMIRVSGHEEEVPVSQRYAEQVHHLFSYGMNACGDQELVKDCLVELFALMQGQTDLLRESNSVDTKMFKLFRRLLIRQIDSSRASSICVIHRNLFSKETQITKELTNLQREALFLKFHCRLTYREVANVMDLTTEDLHRQVCEAVDGLLHR